ncbi:nitroreductase family protein [Desulfurivibrio dismutans]|uniref:nitroreductase family protein n=1 Tax=Desulfurivibrio dismutans TaxID=1398908 RepID=UPI0023DC1E02|nr:nitroreductase family protein [Desulfurivibrio alkaliphilus]MDF1615118.1 nitroreductase family protein [Desulfurivibrio alkaliphilus]
MSMELISIDRNKCKRDGICMAECPFGLISEGEDGGYPATRRAATRICIDCGHCLAVCPHGALTLKGQGPESCLPLDRKLNPSPEATAQLLRSRRSTRNYKDKPVPREVLNELLDISRWAPSVKNAQPTKWLVIESAAEKRRMIELTVDWMRANKSFAGVVSAWEEGKDKILNGAPSLVIAYASDKALKPEIDCTIALTYLDLAAHGKGLGTCWAGLFLAAAFNHPPLLEALALPENHRVHGALMLGYPKYRFARIPQRHPADITWR